MYVSMSTETVEVWPSLCTKALVFDTIECAPTAPPPLHSHFVAYSGREIEMEIELIE
jgi:hypothetical protein